MWANYEAQVFANTATKNTSTIQKYPNYQRGTDADLVNKLLSQAQTLVDKHNKNNSS